MIVKEIIGSLLKFDLNNRTIEHVMLEWYEVSKKILHKKTDAGREIIFKLLQPNQSLAVGDIVFANESTVIVIDIIECDAIVIFPQTMLKMANICYEIGNKHLPLFYQDDHLLVPFDAPLFRLLQNAGYTIETGKRKLTAPLKTTVQPHTATDNSLFSKLIKLTTNA